MTTTSITKVYDFCSAHWLPEVPETHKCHRVHGHNYKVEITVRNYKGGIRQNGFVIDYWDLDMVIDPLIEVVDHKTLNDVAGLENPTAEIIAAWFMAEVNARLIDTDMQCDKVIVHETHDSYATVILGGSMFS